MRTCIHCAGTKPLSEFTTVRGYIRKKSCIKCSNLIKMQPKNQHGIANDFHRLRNVELVFTRLRESGGCVMCGDTRLAVLEFHHLDRTHKRFNVSRGLSYGSIKSLSDEMNKCIVLCSNCHGIVTAIEDGTVRVAFIEENDLNNYHRAFRSPTP